MYFNTTLHSLLRLIAALAVALMTPSWSAGQEALGPPDEDGVEVRGRVVDPRGESVVAGIRFARDAEVAKSPSFTWSFSCTSALDGSFVLFVNENPSFDRQGVVKGTLTATSENGAVALRGQRWSLDDLPQDLVLILGGAGSLSGVVRDAAGDPAPGVPLLIVREDFAALGRELQFVGQRALDRDGPDGLVAARHVTNSLGRFDAHGLQEARYTIRVLTGHHLMLSTDVTLTPEPVLADGRALDLVYSRPGLRLVLLTPNGEPWLGPVDFPGVKRQAPQYPSAWPEVPTVLVSPMRLLAGAMVFDGEPRRAITGRRLPDGSILLRPGPVEAVEVRVLGGSKLSGFFGGEPQLLRSEENAFLMAHEVRAEQQASKLGTVELRVSTVPQPDLWPPGYTLPGEGSPSPGNAGHDTIPFWSDGALRLILVDATTGAPVFEAARHEDVAPWKLQLPAGRYRILPWCERHWFGSGLRDVLPIAPRGTDWEFTVLAGESVDFAVESMQGARITLTMAATASEGEKAYSDVTLIDAGGTRTPLYRIAHRWDGGGSSFRSTWPLGKAQTSTRVRAGRYTLRCTMHPTGRVIERSVTLVEGETLKLSL